MRHSLVKIMFQGSLDNFFDLLNVPCNFVNIFVNITLTMLATKCKKIKDFSTVDTFSTNLTYNKVNSASVLAKIGNPQD